MKIRDRRIQIAGSANANCDREKLNYAHGLVGLLARVLLQHGASLSVQVGKEPKHYTDENLSIIFDWTVIEEIHKSISSSSDNTGITNPFPLTTVITEKTEKHVPDTRKYIWQMLFEKPSVYILNHPQQWTAGAIRRDRLATASDILILISGGEGVEHLAQLYIAQRKPVLALDLDLGASTEQGGGRAVVINREIASNPEIYLDPKEPQAIGAMWRNMTTENGTRPESEVVSAVLEVLDTLEPPRAFCVRLLDPDVPNFAQVEYFFQNIVNPAVEAFDHKIVVSPQSPTETRWLTESIFREIHNGSLIIADLTGERSNCFIELGYALGRNRRVLITAMKGTKLPFDIDKLECFFWSSTDSDAEISHKFKEYMKRNFVQAPLVPTVSLF